MSDDSIETPSELVHLLWVASIGEPELDDVLYKSARAVTKLPEDTQAQILVALAIWINGFTSIIAETNPEGGDQQEYIRLIVENGLPPIEARC